MDKQSYMCEHKLLLFVAAALLLFVIVSLTTSQRTGSILDSAVDASSKLSMGDREGLTASGAAYGLLKRPNIIFMMADDMGYGDVHYNGGKVDTPNLDSMAAGGNSIHLTRYYSGSPVCSPTRGSVLTGRNPNRYCIWAPNGLGGREDFTKASKYPLPTSETTIAEILKGQGYHTAIFGKWHLGDLKEVEGGNRKWPVSHPGMHGFDHWLVTTSSAPTLQLNCGCFNQTRAHCPAGHYGTPISNCVNYYTADSSTNELVGWPEPIPDDDSIFMLERLSEFLESVLKTDKPFFVYFPFHTVHIRYIANAKYRELYLARGYSLHEADYFGAISAMDEVVGKVQALLHHYNIYDNTMLWFTSDNGPMSHTPGQTAGLKGRKRSLWEGGIRVPGIIQWPAVIKENRQSDYPVVSSDLLPTVCDIIGVEPPTDRPIDGISVLPFIRGDVMDRDTAIAWEYGVFGNFSRSHHYVLLRGRYKLFASYAGGKVTKAELYDVVSDRSEEEDISNQHFGLFQSMKAELEQWKVSVIRSATEVVKCM